MSDVFGLRGSTGVAASGAGYGGNPLVAAPVDTTTPFSGLRLIDDGYQIQQAIKNGDWLSGSMAGVAAIADGLQFAFNPIAGVVSWVVGWILDHVEPLKGWLNDLTGDAGEVSAASATWNNISQYLMSAGDELLRSLEQTLAQQTSLAVEAYKRLMKAAAEHVEMASGLADAISSGLMVAATIVQIVHDLVRDAISDIIGQFASAVIQAALSLGTLVPKIVADIAWKVSSWVTRIGTKIDDVIRSSDRLSALFKKADDLLARLKNAFNRIIHGADDAPTGAVGVAGRPRSDVSGTSPNARTPDLDAIDLQALKDYTGDGYWDINAALRGEIPMTPEIQLRIDQLDEALSKIPSHQGTTFRGTDLSDAQLARYQPGHTIRESSYTSTDLSSPFPGNTQFIIDTKSGRHVTPYSAFQGFEDEVLIPRATKFRVVESYTRDGVSFITLVEV